MSRIREIEDLTGRDFTDWHVVRLVGRVKKQTMWWCRCKCGREKAVAAGNLKSGKSPHCNSCANRNPNAIKHNPLYGYHRYLLQRKSLSPEWNTFPDFFAAVGPRPKGMSLIRHDPRNPFGPGNGSWGYKRELSEQQVASLLTDDLDERQRVMLNLRLQGFLLRQIGDACGLTREWVRQLTSPNAYSKRIAVAKRKIAWHHEQIRKWERRLAEVSPQPMPATIDEAAVARIEAGSAIGIVAGNGSFNKEVD